ncbi:pectate lyase [Vibrio xiamenensis]|uniref:Pectate lyase n=1 Tax=Vibrio xiamenensis TaxID=861298 RepID=A0A1G7YAR5_9VIBR|nr:hypothetical protein [Vibrio xiamenensis]SDG93494.1 pectate lyase [Vibrio xiamenensis]
MKKTYLSLLLPLILAGCTLEDDTTDTGDDATTVEDTTSVITSADGWAAVDGSVTGGADADEDHIYTVTSRSELIEALYGDADASLNDTPSDEAKIIYINGSIDLTADDEGNSRDEESFMAECSEYIGDNYTDYETFYTAYEAEYDPNVWNNQSLVDGDPPELTGELEEARSCYQQAQAAYIKFRVGSNTSIIGIGDSAEIKYGNLVLGKSSTTSPEAVSNIIIRNVTFTDAFDMFPAWDPGDSFSISSSEVGTGNCSEEYESDTVNPNGCETIKGGRWNSEYDLISVDNATAVWIDHNEFSDGERTDDNYPPVFDEPYNAKEQKVQHHDGLVDITNSATKVTLSYNKFENHDKTNLLGGSDTAKPDIDYGPGAIDVTFHNNYWSNTGQRLPRVRFGRVHLYNNYYDLNTSSDVSPYYPMGDAIILGTASKIFAENNVFEINSSSDASSKIIGYSSKESNKTKCVSKGYNEDECGTYFYASGNTLDGDSIDLNTIASTNSTSSSSSTELTIIDPDSGDAFWTPQASYDYELQSVDTVKQHVINNAGVGKIEE